MGVLTVIVRFSGAGHPDGGVRGQLEEVGRQPVTFRSATDLLELLLECAHRDEAELADDATHLIG